MSHRWTQIHTDSVIRVYRCPSVANKVYSLIIALCISSGCISNHGQVPNANSKPTHQDLVSIRDEMRAWVEADAIRRYAWDDASRLEDSYTHETLCRQLIASHGEFEHACAVTFSDCLRALETPTTLDESGLNRWAGVHRDVNRNQPKPDDAVWRRAHWVRDGEYWQQDVVWAGEAPRRGWNRADADGLWGWDPKLPGDFKGSIDDDGQRGWRGVHVGYPFRTADGCDCILWITPKEAYLECLTADGIRTGAGLWHRYEWTVKQD